MVVRKEFNVINSFTLEASFCGPNIGKFQDCHFTPTQLRDAGKAFCISLNNMKERKIKVDLLKELQSNIIPSNDQIDNILKEYAEKDEEDKEESPGVLKQTPIKVDIRLSSKSKRSKAEYRSYSKIETLSLTHTAGLLNKPDNNL